MAEFRPLQAAHTHVLIVEDEINLRKLLVRSATRCGFQVESAWSGEEAMRLEKIASIDIAVLDYHLPGIDGIQTLRKIRECAPFAQAIMLTGFGSIEVAKQAIHLDVVEFLTKPCNQGELERALDRALRRRAMVAGAVSPLEMASTAGGATLEEVERLHILTTLSRNGGNRSAAARELGVTRKTLLNKLKRYEQPPGSPPRD